MPGNPVFEPISYDKLSGENRKKALEKVNLIKCKKYVEISRGEYAQIVFNIKGI